MKPTQTQLQEWWDNSAQEYSGPNPTMAAAFEAMRVAFAAGAAQQRETDAAICEAHDPTIDVYNSPLNGMRHPVAEQTAAACAAAIRAQQEAKG